MTNKSVLDMTRGIYRRIYAGFIGGQRINSVSVNAEALFWRLTVKADDFGNYSADPDFIKGEAAWRRVQWSSTDIAAAVNELKDRNLLEIYEVAGEWYLHINDFEILQPANRNGRRIKKFPNKIEELGGIPGNPGAAMRPESDTESESDTDSQRRIRKPKESVSRTRDSDEKGTSPNANSCSGSEDPARRKAFMRFRVEASRLWCQGGKQRHADDASTTALFDSIWPADMAASEGESRAAAALALVSQAATRKVPMAWLTSEVKVTILGEARKPRKSEVAA